MLQETGATSPDFHMQELWNEKINLNRLPLIHFLGQRLPPPPNVNKTVATNPWYAKPRATFTKRNLKVQLRLFHKINKNIIYLIHISYTNINIFLE